MATVEIFDLWVVEANTSLSMKTGAYNVMPSIAARYLDNQTEIEGRQWLGL